MKNCGRGEDALRASIESLAKDWDTKIFDILAPTGFPNITIKQIFVAHIWKAIIEHDMSEILKNLKRGERRS